MQAFDSNCEQAFEELVYGCMAEKSRTTDTLATQQNAKVYIQQAFQDAKMSLDQVDEEAIADHFEECLANLRTGLDELANQAKTLRETPDELRSLTRPATHENAMQPYDEALSEQNLQNLLQFAQEAAHDAKDALGSITREELDVLAHLSLTLAKGLLPVGESMLLSCCDASPSNVSPSESNSSARFELLPEDEASEVPSSKEEVPAKLRQLLGTFYHQAMLNISKRPYVSSAAAVIGLPFAGLLIPIATLVGVGLVVEAYVPTYSAKTIDMLSNAVQVIKLWALVVKIGAKSCGRIAWRHLKSLQLQALEKGIVATSVEAISSVYTFSSVAISNAVRLSSLALFK